MAKILINWIRFLSICTDEFLKVSVWNIWELSSNLLLFLMKLLLYIIIKIITFLNFFKFRCLKIFTRSKIGKFFNINLITGKWSKSYVFFRLILKTWISVPNLILLHFHHHLVSDIPIFTFFYLRFYVECLEIFYQWLQRLQSFLGSLLNF